MKQITLTLNKPGAVGFSNGLILKQGRNTVELAKWHQVFKSEVVRNLSKRYSGMKAPMLVVGPVVEDAKSEVAVVTNEAAPTEPIGVTIQTVNQSAPSEFKLKKHKRK